MELLGVVEDERNEGRIADRLVFDECYALLSRKTRIYQDSTR